MIVKVEITEDDGTVRTLDISGLDEWRRESVSSQIANYMELSGMLPLFSSSRVDPYEVRVKVPETWADKQCNPNCPISAKCEFKVFRKPLDWIAFPGPGCPRYKQ